MVLLMAASHPLSAQDYTGQAAAFESAPAPAGIDALTDSLAAHWSMNEASGTSLADSSTYGNTAGTVGNPTFIAGKLGNAISLSGAQNATAPNSASLNITTGAITLAAWIRPTVTVNTTMDLLKKAVNGGTDGYELAMSIAGKVFLRLNQVTSLDTYRLNSITSYPLNNTAWMHVAATYDGTTANIYINGVLDASTAMTVPGGIVSNSLAVGIGAQSDNARRYTGLMDDARIYRRALSAAEILTLATTYTITASAGANGAISPSGAIGVAGGASQTFTITPAANYHIADVVVDGVGAGPVGSYTFTNVTANHTISASFAIETFTITASAGANGSLSPSGAVVVNSGASQTFTITPAVGYHVLDVLVDGSSMGAVASHTFTNVTANHTISASFEINTWTITASAGANGSISPSGAVVLNHGASLIGDKHSDRRKYPGPGHRCAARRRKQVHGPDGRCVHLQPGALRI